MADTITAPPQTPATAPAPARQARIHFSIWDRVMRFSDIGLGVWSILMFIFLYLPIVVLVIFSFNDQKLNVYWTHFTTKWYWAENIDGGKSVLHDPDVINAFVTSIQLAILSTIIAVVIATAGAFALERFEFRSKMMWDGLNYTKIIIAEVVAGVSTLLFFVQLDAFMGKYLGFDFGGIFVPGFWTVLIAHVAWNIPFAIVIIRARLKGFDRAIEEAGADLYGRPMTVFFRITLPIIFPGILAASLLCFTLSFDDFVTTFFTAGASITTLPLLIWSRVRMGITPEINAISTFMVAFSATIIIVLELKARVSKDII
jgi:ABC-type spermidine/putrescine transport system permease subunit II